MDIDHPRAEHIKTNDINISTMQSKTDLEKEVTGNHTELSNHSVGIHTKEGEELYELDDNNIVSVRNLEDIVEESHIDMPAEVQPHDWLVLNLSSQNIIESY